MPGTYTAQANKVINIFHWPLGICILFLGTCFVNLSRDRDCHLGW